MPIPRLLVFASGSSSDGGSGFENLVLSSRNGSLSADIVGVVSNHQSGGVHKRAVSLSIPFFHFPKPWDGTSYKNLAIRTNADFIVLSGWVKRVVGLDPSRTFNIHPAPLPRFGGRGMYGIKVHEAVIAAYSRREIDSSEVCMHFVTDTFDQGPVFFRLKVKIDPNDTPESLQKRIKQLEHIYQPKTTNLVVNGLIGWNGSDPLSLTCSVSCETTSKIKP